MSEAVLDSTLYFKKIYLCTSSVDPNSQAISFFFAFIDGFIVSALRTIEMWILKVNLAFWDV